MSIFEKIAAKNSELVTRRSSM